MSIDWSKYGVNDSKSSSNDAQTSVDFSKYAEPRQPDFQQQEQKFGSLNLNPQLPTFQQNTQPDANQPNSFADTAQSPTTGRDIPIIGSLLKGLDWLSGTKAQHLIADVGQALYTPGAGLANVAGLTGAAEQGIAKVLPNLASSASGRLAQTVGKEAITGAPIAMGQTLSNNSDASVSDLAKQGAFGVLLGGVGGAAGSALSKSFDNLFSRFKPSESTSVEQTTQPTLGLPEPRSAQRLRDAQQRSILEPNTDPIYGQGDTQTPPTLGLPEGQYTQPTRLKMSSPDETLSYVMGKIKPEVMQTIEAPARRDLLVQYIQKNMQIPLDEIHNMPMNQLQDLGQNIQQDLHAKMPEIATQVAAKYGHDLPSLLEGQAPNLREQVAKDAQSQVYGVPARPVNIQKPNFNVQHVADAAMPETKFKAVGNKLSDTKPITDIPKTISTMQESKPLTDSSPTVQKLSDFKPPTKSVQSALHKDELGFVKTVKEAGNTTDELVKTLGERNTLGKVTTNKADHATAVSMIEKHGIEGMKDKILSLKRDPSPSEVIAGNIISQHYMRLEGDHNLNTAADIIFKMGKDGRKMGQAIQAFSTFKKLDESGALMIATRHLNRDIKDTADWKNLTLAEAKPIKEAAANYQKVEEMKPLADEVHQIILNKKPGELLTDAEKHTIQNFQSQTKLLNDSVKQFLPKEKVASKADEVIKQVGEIKPKERSRDQVVSFLDAKAAKARARIAASRNKISSTPFDIYADYAIIGASHIAKGVVKLSDFTEQMVKDFGESVKPGINEIFNKANNIFRKENGLPTVQELDKAVSGAIKNGTFTVEQSHQFKAWANEIGHYADTNMKTEATQDLQKAMNQIGTSTLGQKLSTIQTSAQLLSLPTAERNVIGNEAFNLLEKLNKVNAVAVDWATSKLTGERSIVFITGNQESYWNNFVKGAKGGWNGVSPNGQFAALDIHPEAFKGKYNPFRYLQKATGAVLQSFDHAAYRRAYGETLGTYAKLTGTDINSLDQSIHELADHAGQYATFQDETMLSKLAVKGKNLLNKPTDILSQAAVKAGMPEKYSLEGFGMGDLVLKYAKTPANIIMRGIDYSPIGILRGLGEFVPLLGKKQFDQRQAVLALSRGITGTLGLTGVGYALISAGVLTGAASSDKDIQQLDKMTGKGEYKVNWSALERYVTSGLDKSNATWQKGDRIFDWGWIQPMAISLAMGVNAQQSLEKQKVEGTQSMLTTVKDALIGSMKTIMQQPLLQGTQQLATGALDVAKYGSWSGIANILKGAPASFVPAVVNQARNFNDNTSRITYDPSALKSALNMIMNKIPGLDNKLPIAYDSLGNQKEQIQGGQGGTLSQGLQSFASPVKPTTYTVSPQAKLVLDLIDATGDTKVAPRTPNSYVMVDKKKIPLTPSEYSQVQQQTGQLTQQMLIKITPLLENPNIKDDIKAKEVIAVLDRVGKQVRNDLEKGNPSLRSHALRR